MSHIAIIGGGLAGCECAWRLAQAGIPVRLFEMKPIRRSPAHQEDGLAELVCSNSLRSEDEASAIGELKVEMRMAGSLVMEVAEATRVPAGKALAVDRRLFSDYMTRKIESNPLIEVVRAEVESLDSPLLADADRVVVAAGPLVSDSLASSLAQALGDKGLYFYDAIAPIVTAESVDMEHAFWGSRYRPEDDDYLNCPLTEEEYKAFVRELLAAETVPCREFEEHMHFEGCLPIEEMAARGEMTLAFGPMKPVGLDDPRTGRRPYAVLQLRAENRERTTFNLVGFQTKLKYPEQKRVFALIPGLRNAEYVRLGSIHRNTFVNAPVVLTDELELKARPGVHLAGQITGVEGYLESAACGLWVGMLLAAKARGQSLGFPPRETALGALLSHLRTPSKNFQPSNVQFGLAPALDKRAGRKKRKELYAERAREAWSAWLGQVTEQGKP
ncbi:methylenetetrahydrofolate--tRNA-(uracil(54)-C(5))-methyltransferase (FADH(2)-oxidizing) TrmFO [Desulfocurvibacter africanus]|uniref:Methylenetetrahydrofolate--tRNA-(uracil-5-)-methyltransferase TrmFO n=1 Tax=Desulfocurvibacter africanus subsp. africanus str. Walvis Bay TaxID=690850 RepID=F3YXU6_DESAF|nr:methylenetetrahydrofolate--tRNA-(uracil(54)-C(5))-methyltransferase (FADH(2)-oxidizing) TrmFO [Desulfocurvibacter africanus]EGJ50648.1 Methylenetetrahydrofolate--tRNA-(uracil-5-)-methyltransferase trmFO [Desulfocurvibacter africanus subsp. africanus str. Walvis Bay]